MPKIGPKNLGAIERTPTSPAALTHGIWEILRSSTAARAQVDSCDPETGRYRVVLQGTLDLEYTAGENT